MRGVYGVHGRRVSGGGGEWWWRRWWRRSALDAARPIAIRLVGVGAEAYVPWRFRAQHWMRVAALGGFGTHPPFGGFNTGSAGGSSGSSGFLDLVSFPEADVAAPGLVADSSVGGTGGSSAALAAPAGSGAGSAAPSASASCSTAASLAFSS